VLAGLVAGSIPSAAAEKLIVIYKTGILESVYLLQVAVLHQFLKPLFDGDL
jgi:hypothetical protein